MSRHAAKDVSDKVIAAKPHIYGNLDGQAVLIDESMYGSVVYKQLQCSMAKFLRLFDDQSSLSRGICFSRLILETDVGNTMLNVIS
jgi:hypothetical protein